MKRNRYLTQIILVVLVSLTLAAATTSANGAWTTRADIPTARWEHSTCVVDGNIYAIGGAGPIYQALSTVEMYDPETDIWTEKSEMPTARQGLTTSVVDGKIYAIGGVDSASQGYSQLEIFTTVEEYDPETDTWTTKSPMPTARAWHSANVVDGKILIIGGEWEAKPGVATNHVLVVEVYDPATDTWSQKGDMPKHRAGGSSSVVDGKIYLFGGHGGAERVDEYDPVTDSWTAKSEMPTARNALSTSVLNGKIYLIGGNYPYRTSYKGIPIVDVYDAAKDTWTTAPDKITERFSHSSSVVDGKIYVIGGLEKWIGEAIEIVDVYDPDKE